MTTPSHLSSNTKAFNARKIITMNPAQPSATHVAVRDGRILAVGNEDDMKAWGITEFDARYANDVLMPGLVEGHCHLHEGVVWSYVYVGYYDRKGPDGKIWTGLKSIDAVVERLKEHKATLAENETLVGWGFDPIYFGSQRMSVHDLDKVSNSSVVVVMHASMHLMNVNTTTLQKAGIDRFTDIEGIVKFDDGEPTGELLEFAAMFPVTKMLGNPFRTLGHSPESLARFGNVARNAGVTTATDLVNELPKDGITTLSEVTARTDFPVRIVPAASGMLFGTDVDACLTRMDELKSLTHDKLNLGIVKLVIDGSIQGFTARLRWPGYFNGAENGIWVVSPAELPAIVEGYHKAKVQLHIHTNGDEATAVALDALEKAIEAHPWPDHRHTLQHCQMADPAQFRKMAKLGVCVNLFSNHLYYWGDAHYEMTMGPDRANRMNSCRTALDHNIPMGIHSDAPITPLGPLFTAWCAVNRQTSTGRTLGSAQKIAVNEALHAITMGAAYTLRMDDRIGSIEIGKHADFCVIDRDPLDIAPEELKDIKVLGTILNGNPTTQFTA